MGESARQRAQTAVSAGVLRTILLSRTTINSSFRVVYPFLPAISRGLGVPLTAVSLLLTLRALAGLSSPLFGPLSDRYGRRSLMLAGLGMLAVATALMAGWPIYGVAVVAFVLIGLSKTTYDPAMQAYLGDAVPYHRRGRVMGLTELSWAAAWLVGVPAAGFLIERAGWQAPFIALTLLALVGLLFTWRLPPDRLHWASPTVSRSMGPLAPPLGLSSGRRLAAELRHNRSAWLGMVVGLLFMFAIENVFVVYGAWMEETFSLSVGALGLASGVIGIAEVMGEGASAGLVDRLGKKRAVLGGLLLNAGAYLLLPLLSGNLASALVGLFVLFMAFEFSIVSSIPLISELAPGARGTLMALNVAALSVGRMAGSLTATPLWLRGGLTLNGVVSCGAALAAFALLFLFVSEPGRSLETGKECTEQT
jgi:predicted MFS family arabinose efflux permease